MSFTEDLSALKDRVIYNSFYAPDQYPAEDRVTFAREFEAMHSQLEKLISSCRNKDKARWLALAMTELETAGTHLRNSEVDAGQERLTNCEDYLTAAASGRQFKATFLASEDGVVGRDS